MSVHADQRPESADAENAAQMAQVQEAMRELPKESRAAVELRYFDGLKDAEIAAVLELKPNTVTVRIKRALETLYQRAVEKGLIDAVPPLDIIGLEA